MRPATLLLILGVCAPTAAFANPPAPIAPIPPQPPASAPLASLPILVPHTARPPLVPAPLIITPSPTARIATPSLLTAPRPSTATESAMIQQILVTEMIATQQAIAQSNLRLVLNGYTYQPESGTWIQDSKPRGAIGPTPTGLIIAVNLNGTHMTPSRASALIAAYGNPESSEIANPFRAIYAYRNLAASLQRSIATQPFPNTAQARLSLMHATMFPSPDGRRLLLTQAGTGRQFNPLDPADVAGVIEILSRTGLTREEVATMLTELQAQARAYTPPARPATPPR